MRVPQYEPQVQEQEGQAVRVPQLSTPPEAAFGTGVAQATQQLGNTIEHASDQLFEHMMTRTKAAQRAQVIQGNREFKVNLQNMMFGIHDDQGNLLPEPKTGANGEPILDPETKEPVMVPSGFINRNGYDAEGSTPEFDRRYAIARNASINSMKSPYQKQAMQEATDEDYARYRELVARHEGTQIRMGHNQTNQNYRDTLISQAANSSIDPNLAVRDIQNGAKNVHQDLTDNGDVFNPTPGARTIQDSIIKKSEQFAKSYLENAVKPLISDDPTKATHWLDQVKAKSDASDLPVLSPANYSDLKDKIMTESRHMDEIQKFTTKKNEIDQMKYWNSNETPIASKIANGQMTIQELDKERNQLSPGFYHSATAALKNLGNDPEGTPQQQSAKAVSLMEELGQAFQTTGDERTKELLKYRADVLANSTRLSPALFTKLLGWSDPNFIEKEVAPKATWFQAGIAFIKDHAVKYGGDAATAISDFISNATKPDVSQSDISKIAQQSAKAQVIKRQPALMGKEDVSNNVATQNGIQQVYGGDTNLKPDHKITASTTSQFKTGDERDKDGITYVRDEEGKWHPKP